MYHQEPNDKDLYHASKELIFNSYSGNSPFRSGALVRHYKDKYKAKYPKSKVPPFKETKPNKLQRYFDEKWVDITPLANPKAPPAHKVYRPTKRVEGKTGALVKELSKSELKKLVELKQKTGPFMPIVDDIKVFLKKGKGGYSKYYSSDDSSSSDSDSDSDYEYYKPVRRRGRGQLGHMPPVGAIGRNSKGESYTIVYNNGEPYEHYSRNDERPYTGGIAGYGLVNLEPDYKELDWGSFTKQFENRKQKNIKDLKEFAEYIIKHKEDFAPKTLKRARFYINVILKKGKGIDTTAGATGKDQFGSYTVVYHSGEPFLQYANGRERALGYKTGGMVVKRFDFDEEG